MDRTSKSGIYSRGRDKPGLAPEAPFSRAGQGDTTFAINYRRDPRSRAIERSGDESARVMGQPRPDLALPRPRMVFRSLITWS